MKKVEEMTDRELLMELVIDRRRQAVLRYVRMAIWTVVIVAAVVLVYKYMPVLTAYTKEVRVVFGDVKVITEKGVEIVNGLDQDTVDTINRLVSELKRILEALNINV